MQKEIDELREKVLAAIGETKAVRALYDLKMRFQSDLKGISGGMKDLPKEERPAFGKILNQFKTDVETIFEERAAVLKEEEMQKKYEAEKVDITLPGKMRKAGALHPITLVKNQLIDIFAGMGFKVFEGPEIETDYYNFTALNTPKDHPARDMQDTFYLSENLLLRTQTSAGQIRVMEKEKPPIKILSPGRVFRSITRDRFTIEQCVFNLASRLKKGPVLFTDMLSDEVTRDEIVSYFMAMLELLKLGRLHAQQEHVFDDILILPGRRDEDGDGEPADESAADGEPTDGDR